MELFQDNWNGTGGCAFSAKALERFVEVIEVLNKQPKIAPTGRNSLLMQYEKDDKSLLAFEVGEEKVEKVFIPRGDYALAEMEVYTEDFGQKIVETVRKFYGFA